MMTFESLVCGPSSPDWAANPGHEPATGPGSALSPCFLRLGLLTPAHLALAFTAAVNLWRHRSRVLPVPRSRVQVAFLFLRAALSLVLALASPVALILLYVLDGGGPSKRSEPGAALFTSVAVATLSWLLHVVYTLRLVKGVSASPRGNKSVLLIWCITAFVDLIQSRFLIRKFHSAEDSESDIWETLAILDIVCLAISFITLLPGPRNFSGSVLVDTDSPDFVHLLPDPTRGPRIGDGNYLGVAKDNDNFFSKLLFYWVNPLIKKGRLGRIAEPEDVFDLPNDMTTHSSAVRFQMAKGRNDGTGVSLFRVLARAYGWQFLSIGVLKFIADCAGFACPMLLNRVVSFMDDSDEPITNGYLYALFLSLAALTVAMCNTHFNLLMSELGIRIRAAVVTAIYKQTLSVTSVNLATFSTGEIINFMSTDTDRVVNFSSSVHAAWSLPFQFAVTLYLLYGQVGVSSMAGVALTVVMIPINMCIAKAIGSRSEKMMSAKDQRVKTMSEILSGVRVIKYFTWEHYFSNRVKSEREEELRHLKARKYLDALCVYLWATTPVLISVCTFSMYVLLGNTLTAAKVFTSVALFAMLTGPLNAFPWVLNGLVEASVSLGRVGRFLSLPLLNRQDVFTPMDEVADLERVRTTDVCLFNADLGLSDTFSLDGVNLDIAKGEFVGVVGRVGSGKSALLSSLLGELRVNRGQLAVTDPHMGIGYVSQEPWLQQGTIRDNIIFGKEYSHVWYQKVVDACALQEDFLQLSLGDRTDVGENGVMLSGGQRARVALARAAYQNKEIYLIDDIFSAVDVPVGVYIYNRCIMGLLRNKTRVLCTHHPRFLVNAKKVLLMEEGRIIDQGPPRAILDKVDFKKDNEIQGEKEKEEFEIQEHDTLEADEEAEMIERESRERGVVKFDIYKQYWLSVGKYLSPLILVSMLLMQASRNFTDVWLAEWVSKDEGGNHTTALIRRSEQPDKVSFYLTVYGSIAGANTVFSLVRAFLFAYGGVQAARVVHIRLMDVMIRAKTIFFDCTPAGRILNRFSSDLYTVDDSLPFILNIFLAQLFGVVGPVIVCVYSVPWIVLILIPLAFIYHDIQLKYRPASRDLKRVGSVSLSPIYAHFSETLIGLTTIRAMKDSPRFANENASKLEANQRAQYAGIAAAQWLELRLQLIGCAVVGGIALVAVVQHHTGGTVDPGYLGLAISYALGITSKLSDLVKTFTETEKELVAVERCYQYINNVPTEDLTNDTPRQEMQVNDWPSRGVISFKDVSMRYRDHLPPALSGFTFETGAAEKIGIVGRTGSGKSSIFQTLFRFVIPSKGSVTIDGVDVTSMDLSSLRSSLAIIPQDPFLFSGTVRQNLDPLGVNEDRALWDSLDKSHLGETVRRLGGLEAAVEERGRSFSVGQRQLLCLARAILSDAKIICVDEATANVDLETDRLVQSILSTVLSDRTVLTIAHRTDTIMNCDRVVLMDSGSVAEVGAPRELAADPESLFSRHVKTN